MNAVFGEDRNAKGKQGAGSSSELGKAILNYRVQRLPDIAATSGMLGWRVGESEFSWWMHAAEFGLWDRAWGNTSGLGGAQFQANF